MSSLRRRTGRGGVALAFAGALLLSACAVPPNQTSIGTGAGGATGAAPGAPAVASLPPAPVGAPPADVQRLIGLPGEIVLQWMGETIFVRHDGIAEIWRFAADTCFLDVFLYREKDGLRVAHLDARPREGGRIVPPQSCYGQILAARHLQPAS